MEGVGVGCGYGRCGCRVRRLWKVWVQGAAMEGVGVGCGYGRCGCRVRLWKVWV